MRRPQQETDAACFDRCHVAVALACALTLAGCSDADPPPPEQRAGQAREQAAEPVATSESNGQRAGAATSLLNDFSFAADGIELAGDPPDASQLTVAGGCRAPDHLSLGFVRGQALDDGYFYFSMDSSAPIEPGVTGDVEPVALTWDNGVTVPDGLPAGTDLTIPERLEGSGRLTITSHSGLGMGGRMAARVDGEVSGDAGTARIAVSFDMNLACGR